MAEPVAEAAPPPEAAPVVEPGKNEVPDDYNVLQFDDTPAVEPEAEAPVAETPVQKELRLKELRKKDKPDEFDEDAIEATVNEGKAAKEAHAQHMRLYQTNAEYRVAYLKGIIANDGYQPTPSEQAEIAAASAPKPVETKAPEFTEQQWRDAINKKCKEMRAQSMPEEDIADWREARLEEHIHAPKREADRIARETSEKETFERQRNERDIAKYRPEFEAAVASYPDIVEPSNHKFGYWFKDKEIGEVAVTLSQAPMNKNKSVKDLIGMALRALGREAKPRIVTPTTRPPVTASARVTPNVAPQKKPGKNEVVDPDVIILDVK